MIKNHPLIAYIYSLASHSSYRDVTRLEIHIGLKALHFCKERMLSYTLMTKNHPLLSLTYNPTATT